MTKIHDKAIVYPNAKLGDNVEVGPFTIIGDNVSIGDGTIIGPNVLIDGYTNIGKNCKIFHGACIGVEPQDRKYKQEKSYVEIGDNNIIREFVTIHIATGEGAKTIIGNDCYILAYAHIAHNCIVGNKVTLINTAALGGHVEVEDAAYISAFNPIIQFLKVGKMAIVGTGSKITKDIPPYVMADGHPVKIYGLNTRGLDRNNVPEDIQNTIKQTHKIMFRSKLNVSDALKKIEETVPMNDYIRHFVEFVKNSKNGIHK
jgi:UDP-N-acetylglucosamine acyltransferase